ncbi:MAG: hypothetical protein RLZZ321_1135 [Bacteroidota bacterium]
METHAFDMVVHLSDYQYSFLFIISVNERVASTFENPHTYNYFSPVNGSIFTEMARLICRLVKEVKRLGCQIWQVFVI